MKTDNPVGTEPIPASVGGVTARTLREGLDALRVSPFPFVLVGIAGVLPIFLGAFGVWILDDAYRIAVQRWLLIYSALSLTWLGATHCTAAMLERTASLGMRLRAAAWSGVPLLAACVAIDLGARRGLALILVMLLLQLAMDRRLAARALLPSWYLPLRAVLIGAAVIALGFALLFHA